MKKTGCDNQAVVNSFDETPYFFDEKYQTIWLLLKLVVFLYQQNVKKMKLVRIITADSLENIDTNNLGNHFTTEGNEPAIVSKLKTLSADAQDGEVFYVYVECNIINEEATKQSNEEHPLEKEIVTNPNSPVKILEILDDCFNVVAENIEGNTGNRVHEWANN